MQHQLFHDVRSLSYRHQFMGLQSKSINWFLYDRYLLHERLKLIIKISLIPQLIVQTYLLDTILEDFEYGHDHSLCCCRKSKKVFCQNLVPL